MINKLNLTLKNTSQLILAILAGVLGSYLYSVQRSHSVEVFYILYSTIAGIIISSFGAVAPWKWIPALSVAFYFSGYAFNQNWGQLGPFDLILLAIYSIPCLVVTNAFIYLRRFLTKST